MSDQNPNTHTHIIVPVAVVFLALGGFMIYQYTRITALSGQVLTLQTQLASTTAEQAAKANELAQGISGLQSQTVGLSNTFQQNIDAVKSQVGGVAQAVGGLQKLASIDPEVLRKYSKVSFLNENYTPAHLFAIPNEYLYSNKRAEQIMAEAWPFMKNMMDTASSSGKGFYVQSAYRSFREQQSLKSKYTILYGAGTANAFSADQGYSEHQLGTTADFTVSGSSGQLDGFDKTPAYQWLMGNAYRFGFIMSYPKGNAYYIYEPWHWRFVGVGLATYLHNSNKNFYDLDQRDIDKYLVNTFD